MTKFATRHSPLFLLCVGLIVGATSLLAQNQKHKQLTPHEIDALFAPVGTSEPGTIPRLLAHSNSTGPIHIPCGLRNMVVGIIPASPSDALMELSSHSDLIIVGEAGGSVSHMLPNGSYLYTQTHFVVEDVVKNNPKAPVKPSSTITVGRAGGVLRVNGRMVYAVCPQFLLFRKGRDYLLYLTFIPQTGGYLNRMDGFVFSNGKAFGLGENGSLPRGSQLKSFVGMSKGLLMQIARQAASDAAKARPIGEKQDAPKASSVNPDHEWNLQQGRILHPDAHHPHP